LAVRDPLVELVGNRAVPHRGFVGVLLSDGTGALSRLLLRKALKFVHLGRGVSMEKWSAVIVSAMGRFNRVVAVDIPHHVTQRGNGRRFILDCDADRAVYLKLLCENTKLYGVAVVDRDAATAPPLNMSPLFNDQLVAG
jgi:hypothetical protein